VSDAQILRPGDPPVVLSECDGFEATLMVCGEPGRRWLWLCETLAALLHVGPRQDEMLSRADFEAYDQAHKGPSTWDGFYGNHLGALNRGMAGLALFAALMAAAHDSPVKPMPPTCPHCGAEMSR
jgi:hypothetical protein